MTEPGGSEAKTKPANGFAEHEVEQTPFERGTDPLGDDVTAYRRTTQLVISCVLFVVFVVMAIFDFASGHSGRAILAVVVAALNAAIAVKEQGKPKRPQH